MKKQIINAEQYEAHLAANEDTISKTRETFPAKEKELFDKTRALSNELKEANIPHLFFIIPNKQDTFRFSCVTSKQVDLLTQEGYEEASFWSGKFCSACIFYLKQIFRCSKVKLVDKAGESIFEG